MQRNDVAEQQIHFTASTAHNHVSHRMLLLNSAHQSMSLHTNELRSNKQATDGDVAALVDEPTHAHAPDYTNASN